jgi:hypothetical protein
MVHTFLKELIMLPPSTLLCEDTSLVTDISSLCELLLAKTKYVALV